MKCGATVRQSALSLLVDIPLQVMLEYGPSILTSMGDPASSAALLTLKGALIVRPKTVCKSLYIPCPTVLFLFVVFSGTALV